MTPYYGYNVCRTYYLMVNEMFQMSKNLSITDYAVSRAIKELHQEHELINAKMIANHINGGKTAVYDSLSNLKQANLLKIKDGSARAGGFIYEYLGE